MYTLLIIFFLVALVFSFLCSLWEAVLLSITRSYALGMVREGSTTGRRLLEFKENIDQPLVAILTLNTAAHTIGAVGVGSQASIIWSQAHPLVTAIVVPVVMTLGILILSEIIPKTIGATHWQKLVRFTVSSLVIVIAILYPLVWLGQRLTQLLSRDKSHPVYSHSEFLALAEIGVEEGHIEPQHPTIISNLLSLDSVAARDVMTPRPVVVSAAESTTIAKFYEDHQSLPFSRILLTKDEDPDAVTGYFLKDTMLESLLHQQGDEVLRSIRHDIITTYETMHLPALFNRFVAKREHIALVVDEYGNLAGIVTLEDIIETLIGTEILDEADEVADMRELAREEWERHSKKHGFISYDE